MSWNRDFRAALRNPHAGQVIYVVERVEAYHEPGTTWELASVQGVGVPGLELQDVEVGGQSVQPRSWSSVMGGFAFSIVGDLAAVTRKITKGTVLALRIGFASLPQDRWERVALGQLRTIRATGLGRANAPKWRVECVDLATALRSRLVRTWAMQSILSSPLATTTVAAAWSPGDTTLEVVSKLGFVQVTGGYGALGITAAGGESFILLYTGTGTGPARFTGVVDDVMGTTPVALSAGDVVTNLAYFSGHPIDIARRVLVSRGDGSNGIYDVYPEEWAIGIDQRLIDHDDCDRWKAVAAVATGSYTWQYTLASAQEDGVSWLSALLAQGGFWLGMRQGLVTVRAAQRSRAVSGGYITDITIGDDDIAEVEGYDAFDPTFDFEYSILYVQTATGFTGDGDEGEVATLPAGTAFWRDVSTTVFENEGDVRTEMFNRLSESVKRIPERIALRLTGLRCAELSPGDIVRLQTTRLQSRRRGTAGFNDYVWVQSVTPSYGGRQVRVALLCYPETEEVYA